jgi:hypothetical protein
MLRDLGGLVYEIDRQEHADAKALVDAKVERLAAVDAELRELDAALGPRGETVLREPGIGGNCPKCGELYPSDARFCARCGSDLNRQDTPPAATEPAAAEEPATSAGAPDPAAEPAPAAPSEAPTREQAPTSNGSQAAAPATAEPAAPASATDRA